MGAAAGYEEFDTTPCLDGAAKIISFAVYDGSNSYELALNTRDFTWKLSNSVTSPL